MYTNMERKNERETQLYRQHTYTMYVSVVAVEKRI